VTFVRQQRDNSIIVQPLSLRLSVEAELRCGGVLALHRHPAPAECRRQAHAGEVTLVLGAGFYPTVDTIVDVGSQVVGQLALESRAGRLRRLSTAPSSCHLLLHLL